MTLTAPIPVTDGFGLELSTDPVAATAYQRGVRQLLDRDPGALFSFAQAARHDPQFALATAGIAVATSVAGDGVRRRTLERARTLAVGATRRERQHVEVLYVALTGPASLALALAIKHLDEFPGDAVALSVVTRAVAASGDPDLVARLRRLVTDLFEIWSAQR